MYYVIRFVRGHLQIWISGNSKERFLNLCKNHNICMWNLYQSETSDYLIANIHIRDYFKIISILRKTKTHATVKEKHGLPFYIPFFQKKTIYILSILFVCFYLLHASCHIWAFSVSGNHEITEEEITDFLTMRGIHLGIAKKELPIEQLEMELRESFPVITWASIEVVGTHCMISVHENEIVVSDHKGTGASNIMSDLDGTVVSIVTRNGIPKVAAGDEVHRNSLLVEGNVPIYDDAGEIIKYQKYRADADILVQTKRHFSYKIPKKIIVKKYTGAEYQKLVFQSEYLSFTIPIRIPFSFYIKQIQSNGLKEFPSFLRFKNSSRLVEKNQFKIITNFYLPLYRSKITDKQCELSEYEYSNEEMDTLLSNQVEKFILCLQEKGVQIMRKDVKINRNIAFSEIKADLVTIESVGNREPTKRE